MKSIIYYLNYNNYYNRIVKKSDDINDYIKEAIFTSDEKNFKPNDNIDTFTIENMLSDINPDYAVVYNMNDDGTYLNFSRWFVLEKSRIRAGQYKLTLHRDLIVDNLEDILKAPAYIEKGYSNISPYIYNQEDIKFNQIKTNEIQLKDKSDIQWIYIYTTNTMTYNGDLDDLIIEYPYNRLQYDYTVSSLEEYIYYNYSTIITYQNIVNSIIYSKLLEEDNKIIFVKDSDDYDNSLIYTINVLNYNGAIKLAFKLHGTEGKISDLNFSLFNETQTYNVEDTPYVIYAIPFTNFSSPSLNTNRYINKHIILMAVQQMKNIFADNIYDIQILPYAPSEKYNLTYNQYDASEEDYFNNRASYGTGSLKTVTINEVETYQIPHIVTYTSSRSFNLNIPFSYTDYIANIHAASNYNFVRLASPNYSSVYEFIPSYLSNYATTTAETFNIPFTFDLTFKIFQPYIHISPVFNNIYGYDFNDNKGLIVRDDFSIEQTTSAWSQYVLNNKNYQAMFDRQIENMNINQNYNMAENIFGAVTGTLGGIVGGALVGGPIGAVVGGGAALAGGIADVATSAGKYQETLDYTKDMYNMNIQNVKARPNTIAQQTAFNFNTKPYPVIEFFTTTDKEKEDFKNKIKYNGMLINCIGTIIDFINTGEETYVKAKIIRFNNINNDTNYLNAIASEVNKGFFITYESEE